MAINKEGVELLKADLRANAEMYNQSFFAVEAECGTILCMAGFCYLRQFGSVRNKVTAQEYISAGSKQLGLRYCRSKGIIFDTHFLWPRDLRIAYNLALTGAARVEVACAALDRLNPDGSIKEI